MSARNARRAKRENYQHGKFGEALGSVMSRIAGTPAMLSGRRLREWIRDCRRRARGGAR